MTLEQAEGAAEEWTLDLGATEHHTRDATGIYEFEPADPGTTVKNRERHSRGREGIRQVRSFVAQPGGFVATPTLQTMARVR